MKILQSSFKLKAPLSWSPAARGQAMPLAPLQNRAPLPSLSVAAPQVVDGTAGDWPRYSQRGGEGRDVGDGEIEMMFYAVVLPGCLPW